MSLGEGKSLLGVAIPCGSPSGDTAIGADGTRKGDRRRRRLEDLVEFHRLGPILGLVFSIVLPHLPISQATSRTPFAWGRARSNEVWEEGRGSWDSWGCRGVLTLWVGVLGTSS
jgi:hypothetical protein